MRSFNDLQSSKILNKEDKLKDVAGILYILWRYGNYKYYDYSLIKAFKIWDKFSEDRCAGWLDPKTYNIREILEIFGKYDSEYWIGV